MNTLQLPLKRKWFEMTKAGIKTEEYREIKYYWFRRFLIYEEEISMDVIDEIINDLKNPNRPFKDVDECLDHYELWIRNDFNANIMTLGYPKATDTERILQIAHKGIEIRTGNPEWGAEPGKLYFVIKHGEIVSHIDEIVNYVHSFVINNNTIELLINYKYGEWTCKPIKGKTAIGTCVGGTFKSLDDYIKNMEKEHRYAYSFFNK